MNNENLNTLESKKELENLIDKIDLELEKIKSLPELENEGVADDIHDILNYIHEHPENLKSLKNMINDTEKK